MSKRKRGGANKPADPSKKSVAPASSTSSRAEEPSVSTPGSRPEQSSASTPPVGKAARKSTPPAAPETEARATTPAQTAAPRAVQGKPIKIANLRVPPLPQLDVKPAATATSTAPASGSTRSSTRPPARKSEPPKSEQAKDPSASASQVLLVESPTDRAAASAPMGATVAPPGKRARVAEQRRAADARSRAEEEQRAADARSRAVEEPRVAVARDADAHDERAPAAAGSPATADERTPASFEPAPPARDGAPVDTSATTLRAHAEPIAPSLHVIDGGKMPINGAVFEGASEDDIWTEGLENTASGAAALTSDKSAHDAADTDSHEPAARLARGSSGDRAREAAAFGSSQSLLSTDYYFRQYGAHGLRSMAAEVDDFGFDPHVDAKVRPALEMLCKRYFRVELEGAEQVPEHGRALLVANRSGALPWDGLVLRTALRSARPGLSALRWLAEDSVIHYPFMGVFMNRLGAVRACPENAERLLTQDRLVAVFPEGAQGSRKLFRDRYRLQRFGRGGYVKLALKLGVPVLPTAIIGGEETNPVLGRSRLLGRFFGSDSAPITPTFPWFGLAGLLPAPVRWRIVVGAPIDLSGYGPESADDALVVHRLNEQIRSSLQTLVDQSKQQRGGALFG